MGTGEHTVENWVKRQRASLAMVLGLAIAMVGGCGSPQTSPTTDGPPQESTTEPGTKGGLAGLKILSWQAPTILNPHLSTGFKDAEASRITLEPLASFNAQGELVPILAQTIPTEDNGGVAADGLSVIWKLKPDVKWSDGQPFTAADVVFTYDFIQNPQTGATSLGSYEAIANVEAVDDHTVKVTFKQPTAAWFLPFVGTEGMILPRHVYQDYVGEKARQAPANLQPVGTGPYRVTQFKPGDVVLYEANPHWRGPEPLGFSQVELKGGGDATSAARAVLQTGDGAFAWNLQVENTLLQSLAQGGPGVLKTDLGTLAERIILNFSDPNQPQVSPMVPHPILQDSKVREAIALGIDRKLIAQQLYGVTGEATSNVIFLPSEYNSPNTKAIFDPARAQTLLEEAGWKDTNGNGIRDKNGKELQLLFQTSVNPLRQKTQQIIKQNLQAIGIGVDLKSIDPSVFFSSDPANPDTLERFKADMAMYTTGNTSPDPTKYLQTFTCEAMPQQATNWTGDNYSRYCNPAYDQLFQKLTQTRDRQQRQALIIQMNDLLIKDFVVIPLVRRAEVVGMDKRLTGVELTPWDRNLWNIHQWRWAN